MSDVSDHADMRIRKRMGLKRKAGPSTAARALEQGIRREDTTGPLRRYLDSHQGVKVRVYGHYVFLFDLHNDTMITTKDLPKKYHKRVDAMK